jgi:hypothetical protein
MLRPGALRALLTLLALGASISRAPPARASPVPLDCCGNSACLVECTEGCAAASCATCCAGDPCTGVTCPAAECTYVGTCSAGSCSATNKPLGTACTITTAADGACDAAGACVPAAPVASWAAACEGDGFGCGLDTASRAWCWGSNGGGAMGQGTGVNTALPLPALVVGGHLFASITCGAGHVCALTTAGAAYCWGAPPPAAAPRPFLRTAPARRADRPRERAAQGTTASAAAGWATRRTSPRRRP